MAPRKDTSSTGASSKGGSGKTQSVGQSKASKITPRTISTRANNASTHPGNIQIEADKKNAEEQGVPYRPKRSTEEIQAAREEAEKKKALKREQKKEAIEKLLQLMHGDGDEDDESSDPEAMLRELMLTPRSPTADSAATLASRDGDVAMLPDKTDGESRSQSCVDLPVYHYYGLASTESEGSEYSPEPDGPSLKPAQEATTKAPTRKQKAMAFRSDIEKLTGGAKAEDPDDRKRKGSVSLTTQTETKKPKVELAMAKIVAQKGGLQDDWREAAAKLAEERSLSSKAVRPTKAESANSTATAMEDEDERRGLKLAADVRATGNTVGVKVEHGKPKKSVDSASTNRSKASSKPRNSDLGFDTAQLTVWQKKLLPTLFAYLSHVESPWEMGTDKQFLRDINLIYSSFFPKLGRELKSNSVEYRLMSQRAYEWRGRLADFAVTKAVGYFFNLQDKYTGIDERADYINKGLSRGLPFIYEDPEHTRGPFRAPHILLTFGYLLHGISSSEFLYEPKTGGLALASVAVHRALELWKSGEKPASDAQQGFTYSLWGQPTSNYVDLIKGLSGKQWTKIEREAQTAYAHEFAPTNTSVSATPIGGDNMWEGIVIQDSDDEGFE